MRSSDFAPLGPPAPARGDVGFRPFGQPTGPDAPSAATDEPRRNEPAEEVHRAFQAGYEQGRAEMRSQVDSMAESFVRALEELAAFRGRLRTGYERELLELALGVARKVVQEELSARPEIWLGMIRAAVRRAVDRERIVVRVPPTLAAFLRDATPALRASLEDVKDLEVVEDPSLPVDACLIESRYGEVDLGVDTQLAAAEQALLRAGE